MKDFVIGTVLGVTLLCLIVAMIFVGVPAACEFLESLKRKEDL